VGVGETVERKNLEQWFFRITKYADRLLANIDSLKWSEKVKIAQRNWIGKSEGAEIEFKIKDKDTGLTVFTTRPDTLFGATFMVISPEHSLAQDISLPEVKKYISEAKNKTEIERTAEGKEKTGVFSGLYAINPVNDKEIPVWIADYVLSGYGTGAIMAVPAHDERDFAFAKKYNLEIIEVVGGGIDSSQPYIGPGKLINSGEWDGIEVPKAMGQVFTSLEEKGIGTRKANYHLRDWLISRQRYWGPPIPMIFCSNCQKNGKAEVEGMEGWFTVPEEDLPVLLPDVEDWKPMGTGKSPLANHPEFYKTTCPNCEAEAVRETDVSDTFLDSSWYFLRYPSTDLSDRAFDEGITKAWLPVNSYIGGAEQANLFPPRESNHPFHI
jgi:leucyl-tRNA synthetase